MQVMKLIQTFFLAKKSKLTVIYVNNSKKGRQAHSDVYNLKCLIKYMYTV